jgi:hypothetical protein
MAGLKAPWWPLDALFHSTTKTRAVNTINGGGMARRKKLSRCLRLDVGWARARDARQGWRWEVGSREEWRWWGGEQPSRWTGGGGCVRLWLRVSSRRGKSGEKKCERMTYGSHLLVRKREWHETRQAVRCGRPGWSFMRFFFLLLFFKIDSLFLKKYKCVYIWIWIYINIPKI